MPEKWKKVLYIKQKYPDNYVDETFLVDLRKNAHLHRFSWWEAFTGACAVTHEISCTTLFLVTYAYLGEGEYSAGAVILLLFVGAFIFLLGAEWWTLDTKQLQDHGTSVVVFLSFAYLFSPILATLTQSVSTDTVHAMSTVALMVHIILQDYGAECAISSRSLSLNSALFAAVCLASRLNGVHDAFILVILATEYFVLAPQMRNRLLCNSMLLVSVTGLFVVITSISLFYLSYVYVLLFLAVCILVNFLLPALFVYYQRYKENICGPWDEATVTIQ